VEANTRGQENEMQQRNVKTPLLDIGYFEAGEAGDPVAILMHGFPYDAHACVEAGEMLAAEGWHVLAPWLRGYGPTRFLAKETIRSGEQAALAADLLAFMDALGVERATLAGYDWGGRASCCASALRPDRVAGLITANGYNLFHSNAIMKPAPPEWECRFWYGYYFHSERGRAGLAQYRRELTRLLWEQWSPRWTFDDATFDRTARSFDNEDWVDVVIHSYRQRYGLAESDPAYADLEARLFTHPEIAVPSVILTGQDGTLDGGIPPDASKFTQLVDRRRVPGGHNLIQENPLAIVEAYQLLRHRAD
jgi:pimeloyl-ACP methyl ester carboxylesterase